MRRWPHRIVASTASCDGADELACFGHVVPLNQLSQDLLCRQGGSESLEDMIPTASKCEETVSRAFGSYTLTVPPLSYNWRATLSAGKSRASSDSGLWRPQVREARRARSESEPVIAPMCFRAEAALRRQNRAALAQPRRQSRRQQALRQRSTCDQATVRLRCDRRGQASRRSSP
jgi:hypothetical protein